MKRQVAIDLLIKVLVSGVIEQRMIILGANEICDHLDLCDHLDHCDHTDLCDHSDRVKSKLDYSFCTVVVWLP